MPKISVILPCYNVSKYIATCLDSLINQTLKDIEIICVDDKSTDDTTKIIKQYVQKDERIKLIALKNNSGVSIARNTGIDAAAGEYIGFVDPDDYVDLGFYENLYKTATENDADITKADLVIINTNGVCTRGRLNKFTRQNKLNFSYEFASAIYRKSFLDKHNLRFLPAVSVGEDVNFLVKACYLANKIPVIDSVVYFYIRRTDSAYSEYLTHDKIEKVCQASGDLMEWLNKNTDISKHDYMSILRHVYALLTNNLNKCTSYQDKELVAKSIVDTYKRTRYKHNALKQNFSKYSRRAVACGNTNRILCTFAYKHKRYKLFGFLPILKELCAPGQEYKLMMFDIIPLVRCAYGLHVNKLYICGILALKITH
jgi:glycosyltransferase involved in cell wall biosynthesis